jgi:hypothetical protein
MIVIGAGERNWRLLCDMILQIILEVKANKKYISDAKI